MYLQLYHSYLEGDLFRVHGKVFFLSPPRLHETSNIFQNVWAILVRFFTPGKAKVPVRVITDTTSFTVHTSLSGKFVAHVPSEAKHVRVEVDGTRKECLLFPDTQTPKVISDVDDTFLVSNIATLWQRLYTLFWYTPFKRSAVEGSKDLYCATAAQFFYVSNSQWQLFDLLDTFRAHNGFPEGPFLLKQETKQERIRTLLSSYRGEFYLIGDDSQKDPEIYQELYAENASRIKGICIRHVSNEKRKERVKTLLQDTPHVIAKNVREFKEVLP